MLDQVEARAACQRRAWGGLQIGCRRRPQMADSGRSWWVMRGVLRGKPPGPFHLIENKSVTHYLIENNSVAAFFLQIPQTGDTQVIGFFLCPPPNRGHPSYRILPSNASNRGPSNYRIFSSAPQEWALSNLLFPWLSPDLSSPPFPQESETLTKDIYIYIHRQPYN